MPKPIIDIDIITPDDENTLKLVDPLVDRGRYSYNGELKVPGRHDVKTSPDFQLSRHNLYLCVDGCVSLSNHLGVKKGLLEDEALGKDYSEVKAKVAEQEFEYVGKYVNGKTSILEKILDKSSMLSEEEKAAVRRA
jgi:GrpB-like predicted nucleotidyltransferase (UPF0157 family)